MAAGIGKSSMFVERTGSEHRLEGAAGEPSEDGRDPGAPPPPPPTRMAPAPPPHTSQVGQRGWKLSQSPVASDLINYAFVMKLS